MERHGSREVVVGDHRQAAAAPGVLAPGPAQCRIEVVTTVHIYRARLQLLGHALVSVPYWEWDACKGPGEREQYLWLKLGECGPARA